jgi:hypothetical protein
MEAAIKPLASPRIDLFKRLILPRLFDVCSLLLFLQSSFL